MVTFKLGARVIKARPYSDRKYCKHGGHVNSVPMGTRGKVIQDLTMCLQQDSIKYKDTVKVIFDNKQHWYVSPTELNIIDKVNNIILGD